MGVALRSFDYYDFMDDQPSPVYENPLGSAPGRFYITENIDASLSADYAPEPVAVYTENSDKDSVTIMSAFRKDLFITVTLPVLLAALGSVALGLTAYTHIDSKLDSAKTEASSSVDHLSDTLRQELRADREARAKEFEAIRLEMREDRKDMRDTIKDLTNRS